MDNGLLRIGTVMAVKADERKVQVFFQDEKFLSDWLKVIKNPPLVCTEESSYSSSNPSLPNHSHKVTTQSWLPKVNETVLCIYDSVFNGDGYVLGAL